MEAKIVLNLWNRAGNTSSANNIIDFFECCYHRVNKLIKVKGVLADSGFYMESFIEAIESKSLRYVITAKLYTTIQREIYATSTWTEVEAGLAITSSIISTPAGHNIGDILWSGSPSKNEKSTGKAIAFV